MTQTKYLIKAVIEAKYHTRADRSEVRKKICSRCSIDKQTLSDWEQYPLESKSMIPADQLLRVSKELGCNNIEELFNKSFLVTV